MSDLAKFSAYLRRTNRAKSQTNVVVLRTVEPARAPASTQRALTAVFGFYDFYCDAPLAKALAVSRQHRTGLRHGVSRTSRSPLGVKVPSTLKSCLSELELATVLSTPARRRDQLLLATMGLNGLRIGAALGLRHEDVRHRKGELWVVPRADNVNDARAKRAQALVLPLHTAVARLYEEYLDEEYGDWDSDYVFINLWGGQLGRPMDYDNARGVVARVATATGIPFTAHVLRHSFGTRELNNGASQEVVQELLDHDDPKMTRGYARLSGQRLREEFVAAARFNAAGERLGGLLPDSPLTDVTWMKERLNRARVTLPNGYCSLPLQQTCEVQNACLDCSQYFVTTPEFLPAHEAQHARTAELIGAAEVAGQTRIAEKNRTVLVKLETLMASLRTAR